MANDLGIPCRPVRTLEMLEARLADSPVRALIVDLEAGETAIDMIRRLRPPAGTGSVRIVAFGPHVAVEQFQTAQAAGADAVLARGAFDRRIAEILTECAAG